jgi:hypothetical protein
MQASENRLDRIEALVETLALKVDKLTDDIDKQREETKELGLKFQFYQQSTQAIVNLAFSLIASATVSVFITTIVKGR